MLTSNNVMQAETWFCFPSCREFRACFGVDAWVSENAVEGLCIRLQRLAGEAGPPAKGQGVLACLLLMEQKTPLDLVSVPQRMSSVARTLPYPMS